MWFIWKLFFLGGIYIGIDYNSYEILLLCVCLDLDENYKLFYYLAYFCYYLWVSLHFLVLFIKVLKPGTDRTVRPEKPRTVQFYGLFRVKNRFMPKKQGPARTMVRPSGFVNHDRFLRFERFLFILAFPVNFGQYTGMKLWSDLEKMKEHEEE